MADIIAGDLCSRLDCDRSGPNVAAGPMELDSPRLDSAGGEIRMAAGNEHLIPGTNILSDGELDRNFCRGGGADNPPAAEQTGRDGNCE